jgi:plasmid stabilization system protein ParE
MFYARHASAAIAHAFLAEFERVIELLAQNQQRGPHVLADMRVYHFDRFPYSVMYQVDALRGPQIYAVAHQRREPMFWTGRKPTPTVGEP